MFVSLVASCTYVVIVGVPHFEAPIPLWYATSIAFAGDVLERVTAPPLATVPSAISFHRVTFCEVVPRPDEVDSFDRMVCLSGLC